MLMITVLRTLFYQFLLIFIGLSIGFILNPEWIGIKSILVHRSVNNIFFPIQYDSRIEKWVKEWGAIRVYIEKNQPLEFEVIDENVYANEEYYWCRFKYRDKYGKLQIDEGTARVRWKTWEYYYEAEMLDTPEKIKESIKRDKEQINRRLEEIEKARQKEQQILEKEKKEQNNDNHKNSVSF